MARLLRRVIYLAAVFVACAIPDTASAQAAREGRMQVTVVDPSGAVVPDATVTVIGLETSTQAVTIAPVTTTDKGIAIIERVPATRLPHLIRNHPG